MTNVRCWTNRSATYLVAFAVSATWNLGVPVHARAQTAFQNQGAPAKSWRQQHPMLFPTLIGTAAGAAAGCSLAVAVDTSEGIPCPYLAAAYALLGAAIGSVPGMVAERRSEHDPASFAEVRRRVKSGTNIIVFAPGGRQTAGKVVDVTPDSVTMLATDGTTMTLTDQASTWHLASDSLKNGILIGAAVGGVAAVLNYKNGAPTGGAIAGVGMYTLIGALADRAVNHRKLIVGERRAVPSASINVLPWFGRRSGGIALTTSF